MVTPKLKSRPVKQVGEALNALGPLEARQFESAFFCSLPPSSSSQHALADSVRGFTKSSHSIQWRLFDSAPAL